MLLTLCRLVNTGKHVAKSRFSCVYGPKVFDFTLIVLSDVYCLQGSRAQQCWLMWYKHGTGQQFSKPPCTSAASLGPSVPATIAPTSEQGRGQSTPTVSGQSGPAASQAEAPSAPPPGHELGQLADVEQPGTSDGHDQEQKSGTDPSESGTASASVSRPSDFVVLPQMQHADLQNVRQVRQHF